jgi:dolichol kinase
MTLAEIPYVLLLVGSVMTGMVMANILYDYKVPQYLSRKIGHLGGCVAFLLCPLLFKDFWWPWFLTIGFSGLLLYARWFRPKMFRGVGGSGRPDAFAEIHFPGTGIILIGIMWGYYNQPWLAIVPLMFMGGGDAITGIIRSQVYKREVKGLWGSFGMLVTCLGLAYFVHPYWVGTVGAVVATLAERYTKTRHYIDDNATIPILSGLVMGLLWYFFVR